jgi:flagellar hook-associated protein 2
MSTTATTSTSASGGLDVPVLVSQLMTVANQPIVTLQNQVANDQAEISAWGTVSGLISSFQTAVQSMSSSVLSNSATPSDTSIFSASASSTAVPGNYSLSVSQLAQAQTLVAAGQTSTTTPLTDGTATTLTINVGTTSGSTFTSSSSASVTIDSSNNTLQGISDAINAANLGVTASIVNDGSSTPYRLVLTSNNSGASNSLQITTSGGSGQLNALLGYDPTGTENMTQTAAAQDAKLTVNGIAITSASNTVANAIQGVTLTINNKTTTPASLTVAHDTAAISTAVSGFVSAYNALSTQLSSDFTYGNPITGAAGGALAGDGSISVMQQQLQSIFDTAATPASGGTLQYLAQIGVSFQTNGQLSVDSTTLNSALTSNFSDVSNLLTSSTGFATTLGAWATSVLSPGNGMIDTATQSLNTTIKSLNTNITRLQAQNAQLQATYTTEYSDLNMLLSSLDSTSSYLTSQLSSISK